MFDPKVSYIIAEFALPPKLDEAFRQYGFPNSIDTTRKVMACLPVDGANDKLFFIDKRDKNFRKQSAGVHCTWYAYLKNRSSPNGLWWL